MINKRYVAIVLAMGLLLSIDCVVSQMEVFTNPLLEAQPLQSESTLDAYAARQNGGGGGGYNYLCYPDLPNPQLVLTGTESTTGSSGVFTQYNLAVVNRADYPISFFVAAPDLPPCGLNTNSDRAWVNIYNQDGIRIYGFCTLESSEDLGDLWFAVAQGESPPAQVYITIEDRRCGLIYQSNPVSIPASGSSLGESTTRVRAPDAIDQTGVWNLTGVWNCDDGGIYYIRQLGNNIWWYGEHNPNTPDWSNVMYGIINGDIINGNWADVPKGWVMQNGAMTVKIESNYRLSVIQKTGGFAGSVWTRGSLSDIDRASANPMPLPGPSDFNYLYGQAVVRE